MYYVQFLYIITPQKSIKMKTMGKLNSDKTTLKTFLNVLSVIMVLQLGYKMESLPFRDTN